MVQLIDIIKLRLNSKIKKFSYSFICGKGYSPPSGKNSFLSTVCGGFLSPIKKVPHAFRHMTLSGAPTAIRTRGLSLRRRTLYPTELWMQGTVLPLVFSAIDRFPNQTHTDRRRQNRYKIRSSQSFDRPSSQSLFWLSWWTAKPNDLSSGRLFSIKQS